MLIILHRVLFHNHLPMRSGDVRLFGTLEVGLFLENLFTGLANGGSGAPQILVDVSIDNIKYTLFWLFRHVHLLLIIISARPVLIILRGGIEMTRGRCLLHVLRGCYHLHSLRIKIPAFILLIFT